MVCTETHCNSDFTDDGINCFKVKVGDWFEMRYVIDLMLRAPDMVEMVSRNAIETAARYDYDKVVIPLEAAIQDRL